VQLSKTVVGSVSVIYRCCSIHFGILSEEGDKVHKINREFFLPDFGKEAAVLLREMFGSATKTLSICVSSIV
jgi:hypothetical protein